MDNNNDYRDLDQADEALRNEYTDYALSEEATDSNNGQTEPVPAVDPDNVLPDNSQQINNGGETSSPETNTGNPQQNIDFNAILQQNQALMQQTASMQNQISQLQEYINQNNTAKQAEVIENLSEPEGNKANPIFERFNERFYEDGSGAVSELVDALVAQKLDGIINQKLGGVMEEYNENVNKREWDEAFNSLAADERFSDVGDKRPAIEAIIKQNPGWGKDNKRQDIINAYFIADSLGTQRKPSFEEQINDDAILDKLANNPDFMKKIAARQAKSIKDNNNVPPLSASNGTSNAQPNVYTPPKNIAEADEDLRRMLGLSPQG